MKPTRFWVLTLLVALACLSRFIPHPANFAPVCALALFAGVRFRPRWVAFSVPLLVMFLSDLWIGMHASLGFVYGSYALIVCLGLWLSERASFLSITGGTLASSVLFFIITNFGVWAMTSLYTKDLTGLVTCYVAAIPFFRNALAGDLLYSAFLFGGLALLERQVRSIAPAAQPA